MLRPSGEVALDPDEEVRATIRLVFDLFERRRSVRGVLCYLVDHQIQLPDRIRSGPHKGEIRWNRPNQATLGDMLRHPAYAGAYVYGDYCTGEIFTWSGGEQRLLLDTTFSISSFGEDDDGEIYVVDLNGRVSRIAGGGGGGTGCQYDVAPMAFAPRAGP